MISEVGSRKPEVGDRRSEVGSRTSGLGPQKSDVGDRRSEVGHLTSDLGPRTSDLRPLVSICLPTLNARRFLEPRMESILAQTLTDWELIVCDSYSNDGTWEYFQQFKSG